MTKARPKDDTLPHNLDAERSVLGALLIDSTALELIDQALSGEEFYRVAHRQLFQAITRLLERKVAVDFTTLVEELTRTGELDDVGGPSYVAGLTDGLPRTTNVTHYAAIVREKYRLREVIATGNRLVSQAYAAEDSADTIVAAADKAILDLHLQRPAGHVRAKDLIPELLADMQWRYDHQGEVTGIPTGFASVDRLTFGWQAADMNVLAARPSMGKTTWLLNTAIAASEAGKRVVIFSLEMRVKHLRDRLLSVLSGVELTRIQGGLVRSMDYAKIADGLERLSNLELLIDDRPGQSVKQIRGACRRIKAEGGLDLVIIDYVQLMPGTIEGRGITRYAEVSDISTRTKNEIAGDLDVCTFLVSQLNRGADSRNDPRPQLSDLRESGRLEEDADAVMFLYRPNHLASGTTELIVAKQRNGNAGTVNLTFERDTQTFTDGGAPLPEKPRYTRKPQHPGKVVAPRATSETE
jgi:replicative DNA helicase